MGSGEIARSLNRALESRIWSGSRAENRPPLFLDPLRARDDAFIYGQRTAISAPQASRSGPALAQFNLSSRLGRLKTYLHYLWNDHAYLRVGFQNAHWITPELVRTNQPWPFQLKWWKARGIKTVINLRGGFDGSFYALEKDACERLGIKMVDFVVTSREAPSRDRVLGARKLFEE